MWKFSLWSKKAKPGSLRLKELQTNIFIQVALSFLNCGKICVSPGVFIPGAYHRTKWTLLWLSMDTENSAVLGLQDMSAVFDVVDHATLLKQLSHGVGLKGIALKKSGRLYFFSQERKFLLNIQYLWGTTRLRHRAELILFIYYAYIRPHP